MISICAPSALVAEVLPCLPLQGKDRPEKLQQRLRVRVRGEARFGEAGVGKNQSATILEVSVILVTLLL